MSRAVSTVTSSRHPAAWGAFAASILVGFVGAFIPGGSSGAVDDALPHWFVQVYYGGLLLCGAGGILALCIPELEKRIRVERCAWYGTGWASLFYAGAAFSTVGWSASQASIFCGVFSPIATARIIQITRDLRRIQIDQEKGLPAEPPPLGVADEGK